MHYFSDLFDKILYMVLRRNIPIVYKLQCRKKCEQQS